MLINTEEILNKELIGKEVDIHTYEILNNKYIGDIESKGIIKKVYYWDGPEDVGFNICAELEDGRNILLEPRHYNKNSYHAS